MKVVRVLFRSLRDSIKSVFRNFSLSLASISCITITLVVVAISIILSYNVNNFTKLVEKDVTIVAFIDNTVDKDKISDIEILTIDNIEKKNVKFIDKMTISEEMMATSDVFKDIMQSWTEENTPVQNTYQIKVTDINLISKTADEIKDIEGITSVKYGEGMVEQLVSVFDLVRKGCIGIVIALIVVIFGIINSSI